MVARDTPKGKHRIASIRPAARKTGFNLILNFEDGEYSLTEADKRLLLPFTQAFRQHESWLIHIEGHASRTGNRDDNLWLSEMRAKQVGETFVKNGVSENRIEIQPFGDSKPLKGYAASNPINRRVRIVAEKDASAVDH